MFCPGCGTDNLNEAKFCRKCGANLALVPQALTGQLPPQRRMSKRERKELRRDARRNRPPSIEQGIKHTIMGLGFIIVSIAIFFSPGGKGWFWAFLFPAFSLIAKGLPEILAAQKQNGQQLHSSPNQVAIPPPQKTFDYQAPQTGELMPPPPPSVTEGTTRFFDQPNNQAKES